MSGPTGAVVLGASGLVGSHLLRAGLAQGERVVGTAYRQRVPGLRVLDLRDGRAAAEFLCRAAPGVIFLPAAEPNVERCEREPEATRRINVAPLGWLADLARELGSVLVFYSSDYVFDGRSGPYGETDAPNPISEYGRQKLAAEEILRERLPEQHLILRVTVLYGWERQGKNFLARLVRALRAGEPVRAPVDQVGSPTLVEDLAEASWELVARGARGTYHLAGPDLVDRFTFAVEAARVFGLDPALVEPVTTDALGQAAPRPLRAGMICERAEALLGRTLVGIAEGLRRAQEQDWT